ncbi:ribonuclease H-like domain-containing protein [Tanacetum coccineum]
MSVHNFEHNSPINSDHDDDVHDPVTRISKLDISDPLHLHPNDTTALTVVSIKLKGTENYQVWSCAMLLALEGKNKIGFIDGSCKRSNTDEVLGQIFSKRAKHVWEELKETYDKVDGSIMFGLHNQINTLKQNGSYIADCYHKLNSLWKQYDAMIELPKCVCNASKGFKKHNQLLKLMQFLMGLDDSYMQIRSSILSRETLPDVRSAYATISSEESHRVAVGSIRSNQNFSVGPSRPNNLNNNKQGGGSGLNTNRQGVGSGLVCENYGFNGHTIDRCFKIISYPADFRKKKSGQNFKKQSVSNNISVWKSSSSGFTDEQMATLISLIKNNKVGKYVQANMTGIKENLDYLEATPTLDKNQVCLLCEVILKQIPAFNFFCASLESITAIEKLGKWEKVWEDIPTLYLGFVGREKWSLGSGSSSVSGSNISTANFLVDSGNDADSSDDLVATQNK